MPYQTLSSRSGFRRVMTRGRSARSNGLRIHCVLNGLEHNRYGVAATTKVGGAVVRNRVRRWTRDLLRQWDAQIAPGYDLVVFVGSAEALEGYRQFAGHLSRSLGKAQLTEGVLEPR